LLEVVATISSIALDNKLLLLNYNFGVRLIKACPNGKCLATKHHQTLLGDQAFYRLATLFGAV